MRKAIIGQPETGVTERSEREDEWLALEQVASVLTSSEDPSHPIESALVAGHVGGWRAGTPGEQVVVIRFDSPRHIRRMRLRFDEPGLSRMHEFVVSWLRRGATAYRTVVRQQFNFSPGGATREEEDYTVDLPDATALELRIVPDVSGGPAHATLTEWRLGT